MWLNPLVRGQITHVMLTIAIWLCKTSLCRRERTEKYSKKLQESMHSWGTKIQIKMIICVLNLAEKLGPHKSVYINKQRTCETSFCALSNFLVADHYNMHYSCNEFFWDLNQQDHFWLTSVDYPVMNVAGHICCHQDTMQDLSHPSKNNGE